MKEEPLEIEDDDSNSKATSSPLVPSQCSSIIPSISLASSLPSAPNKYAKGRKKGSINKPSLPPIPKCKRGRKKRSQPYKLPHCPVKLLPKPAAVLFLAATTNPISSVKNGKSSADHTKRKVEIRNDISSPVFQSPIASQIPSSTKNVKSSADPPINPARIGNEIPSSAYTSPFFYSASQIPPAPTIPSFNSNQFMNSLSTASLVSQTNFPFFQPGLPFMNNGSIPIQTPFPFILQPPIINPAMPSPLMMQAPVSAIPSSVPVQMCGPLSVSMANVNNNANSFCSLGNTVPHQRAALTLAGSANNLGSITPVSTLGNITPVSTGVSITPVSTVGSTPVSTCNKLQVNPSIPPQQSAQSSASIVTTLAATTSQSLSSRKISHQAHVVSPICAVSKSATLLANKHPTQNVLRLHGVKNVCSRSTRHNLALPNQKNVSTPLVVEQSASDSKNILPMAVASSSSSSCAPVIESVVKDIQSDVEDYGHSPSGTKNNDQSSSIITNEPVVSVPVCNSLLPHSSISKSVVKKKKSCVEINGHSSSSSKNSDQPSSSMTNKPVRCFRHKFKSSHKASIQGDKIKTSTASDSKPRGSKCIEKGGKKVVKHITPSPRSQYGIGVGKKDKIRIHRELLAEDETSTSIISQIFLRTMFKNFYGRNTISREHVAREGFIPNYSILCVTSAANSNNISSSQSAIEMPQLELTNKDKDLDFEFPKNENGELNERDHCVTATIPHVSSRKLNREIVQAGPPDEEDSHKMAEIELVDIEENNSNEEGSDSDEVIKEKYSSDVTPKLSFIGDMNLIKQALIKCTVPLVRVNVSMDQIREYVRCYGGKRKNALDIHKTLKSQNINISNKRQKVESGNRMMPRNSENCNGKIPFYENSKKLFKEHTHSNESGACTKKRKTEKCRSHYQPDTEKTSSPTSSSFLSNETTLEDFNDGTESFSDSVPTDVAGNLSTEGHLKERSQLSSDSIRRSSRIKSRPQKDYIDLDLNVFDEGIEGCSHEPHQIKEPTKHDGKAVTSVRSLFRKPESVDDKASSIHTYDKAEKHSTSESTQERVLSSVNLLAQLKSILRNNDNKVCHGKAIKKQESPLSKPLGGGNHPNSGNGKDADDFEKSSKQCNDGKESLVSLCGKLKSIRSQPPTQIDNQITVQPKVTFPSQATENTPGKVLPNEKATLSSLHGKLKSIRPDPTPTTSTEINTQGTTQPKVQYSTQSNENLNLPSQVNGEISPNVKVDLLCRKFRPIRPKPTAAEIEIGNLQQKENQHLKKSLGSSNGKLKSIRPKFAITELHNQQMVWQNVQYCTQTNKNLFDSDRVNGEVVPNVKESVGSLCGKVVSNGPQPTTTEIDHQKKDEHFLTRAINSLPVGINGEVSPNKESPAPLCEKLKLKSFRPKPATTKIDSRSKVQQKGQHHPTQTNENLPDSPVFPNVKKAVGSSCEKLQLIGPKPGTGTTEEDNQTSERQNVQFSMQASEISPDGSNNNVLPIIVESFSLSCGKFNPPITEIIDKKTGQQKVQFSVQSKESLPDSENSQKVLTTEDPCIHFMRSLKLMQQTKDKNKRKSKGQEDQASLSTEIKRPDGMTSSDFTKVKSTKQCSASKESLGYLFNKLKSIKKKSNTNEIGSGQLKQNSNTNETGSGQFQKNSNTNETGSGQFQKDSNTSETGSGQLKTNTNETGSGQFQKNSNTNETRSVQFQKKSNASETGSGQFNVSKNSKSGNCIQMQSCSSPLLSKSQSQTEGKEKPSVLTCKAVDDNSVGTKSKLGVHFSRKNGNSSLMPNKPSSRKAKMIKSSQRITVLSLEDEERILEIREGVYVISDAETTVHPPVTKLPETSHIVPKEIGYHYSSESESDWFDETEDMVLHQNQAHYMRLLRKRHNDVTVYLLRNADRFSTLEEMDKTIHVCNVCKCFKTNGVYRLFSHLTITHNLD